MNRKFAVIAGLVGLALIIGIIRMAAYVPSYETKRWVPEGAVENCQLFEKVGAKSNIKNSLGCQTLYPPKPVKGTGRYIVTVKAKPGEVEFAMTWNDNGVWEIAPEYGATLSGLYTRSWLFNTWEDADEFVFLTARHWRNIPSKDGPPITNDVRWVYKWPTRIYNPSLRPMVIPNDITVEIGTDKVTIPMGSTLWGVGLIPGGGETRVFRPMKGREGWFEDLGIVVLH